jgi:uncharacterized DUF497 family protein
VETIRAVEISEEREDHIWKHLVRPDEVEDVCLTEDQPPVIRRARDGQYVVLGQTAAGRYLLVVLAPVREGVFRLVTARDMEPRERRYFRDQRA